MTSTVSDAVFDTSSGHQCMCAWCQTGRAIRRLRELEPAEAARAELDTLDNALNILYEDSFAAWETMNDIATAAGLDWIGATRESILDAIKATARRTSRTTLSLTPEAVDTLRLLADRLGFGGNVSEFLRWLANTAAGAFDETATLLKTAGAIAAGGDDWTVLAVVERLLPALRLTVDWERVDNPPRPIAPPEVTLDESGTPAFRLPDHDSA